jgi:hypothetical protein
MTFQNMTIQGDIGRIGTTQTDVYSGTLIAASKDYGDFFSVQAAYESPIALSMFLSSDGDYREVEIRATSLQISLEGDFRPEAIWDQDGNRTSVVGYRPADLQFAMPTCGIMSIEVLRWRRNRH